MQQVLLYNQSAVEGRLGNVAAYLGIDGGFEGFYNYVGELNAALKIPANLTELGVKDPDIDRLTEMALADPSVGGNPIEMTAENTKKLFLACL